MSKAARFQRHRIMAILSGVLAIAACQCSRAQVPTGDQAASSTSENGVAATPNAAESSSGSQTESAAPQNLSLGSTRAPRGRCDLISAPLSCLGDISRDQAGIWTAPARWKG